jgi:hypothetical protein
MMNFRPWAALLLSFCLLTQTTAPAFSAPATARVMPLQCDLFRAEALSAVLETFPSGHVHSLTRRVTAKVNRTASALKQAVSADFWRNWTTRRLLKSLKKHYQFAIEKPEKFPKAFAEYLSLLEKIQHEDFRPWKNVLAVNLVVYAGLAFLSPLLWGGVAWISHWISLWISLPVFDNHIHRIALTAIKLSFLGPALRLPLNVVTARNLPIKRAQFLGMTAQLSMTEVGIAKFAETLKTAHPEIAGFLQASLVRPFLIRMSSEKRYRVSQDVAKYLFVYPQKVMSVIVVILTAGAVGALFFDLPFKPLFGISAILYGAAVLRGHLKNTGSSNNEGRRYFPPYKFAA